MAKGELANTEQTNAFQALAEFDIAKALTDELAGMDGAFERIKMPTGGGTVFEVPGDEPGETESVKEFTGVILHHHPLNVYYRDEYTGGSRPPNCASNNGLVGQGNPGGVCEACKFNQFGSGRNDGKACQNRRRLFILREGEVLPVLLSIPAGSLKEFRAYIIRLLGKAKQSDGVVTRFTLSKATNKGGAPFSQAHFGKVRDLTPEERALIAPLAEQIKAQSWKIGYDTDAPEDPYYDPNIDPETGEALNPDADSEYDAF
jgi:hypothetical protein